MKIFRLIVMSLITTLVISSFAFTSVSASEIIADKVMKDKVITISEYEEYLLEKSKSNPTSLKVLEQFKALKMPEKKAFLEILSSDDYLKLSSETTSLEGNKQINKTIKTSNGINVPITMKSEEEEKSEVLENHQLQLGTPYQTSATTYRATATGRFTFGVFGITLSYYQTQLTWQHDGSKALKVYDVYASHVNNNPAIWTSTRTDSGKYVSDSYAYGTGNWGLRATGTPITSDLSIGIKARILSDKFKKRTSTHPNISNTGYIKF